MDNGDKRWDYGRCNIPLFRCDHPLLKMAGRVYRVELVELLDRFGSCPMTLFRRIHVLSTKMPGCRCEKAFPS